MKTYVKISPSLLNGTIDVPPSKSFAHRLLILAALKNEKTVIENVGESDDVMATIECLRNLGAKIEFDGNNATVYGFEKNNGSSTSEITLPVNESGSTYRFMIVLSCVLGKLVRYLTNGKLKERPNTALLSVLREHGITFDEESLVQNGILEGDYFTLDATVSSQYITAFMLSLPYLKHKTTLQLKGDVVSASYVKITEETLRMANIHFEKNGNVYTFYPSSYDLPDRIRVEGDWSSASFFIASSFLSDGNVRLSGLNLNSVQGDRNILEVLENIGAKTVIKNDTIFILKQISVKPIICSVEDMIDSVPILSSIAAFINGVSVFKDVERLKIKESNRIEAILDMLFSSGIKAEYSNNEIRVYGGNPHSGVFNGYNDHRIVMASSILATFVQNGDSVVSTSNAVKKSYPSFYNDLKKIGGKFYVGVEG